LGCPGGGKSGVFDQKSGFFDHFSILGVEKTVIFWKNPEISLDFYGEKMAVPVLAQEKCQKPSFLTIFGGFSPPF